MYVIMILKQYLKSTYEQERPSSVVRQPKLCKLLALNCGLVALLLGMGDVVYNFVSVIIQLN